MRKKISYIITTLEIFALIFVASYAWFSDKNSPSISQDQLKVTSAEGLVIKLTEDSIARSNVGLNEIVNDYSAFSLKQMSSADGINFYTIDFGAGLAHNLPKFVQIEKNVSGKIDMDQWGCIDYDFYLETENMAKNVYFHKDSYITGESAGAVRIMVTVTDLNYDLHTIIGNTKEGIDGYPYVTRAVIKEGEFDYNDIADEFVDNQLVHTFDDYNGGRGESDDTSIDLDRILFTIPANTSLKVNVKVWLEGGDPDCTNSLADTSSDVLIKFGSANVLPEAPNVSANNSFLTINNLDTSMEYSFTNLASDTWTSVTDPNVTFERGQTVYVRYKEVEGESLYSYVREVTFNG